MCRLNIFLILMCIAAASAYCGSDKKKDEPKIHIIHVKTTDKEAEEPNIVELHFPSEAVNRRRREAKTKDLNLKCTTNKDCPPNNTCDDKLKKCLSNKNAKENADHKARSTLQLKQTAPIPVKKVMKN